MATEEQLNNQRELNRGLDDYKSGLTDAAEFISLLTSRSSDLVDQYRSLGKAGKTFTNNQKETLSVLQAASKFARNLQNPYESIRDVQKDIEKSQRNQIALVNSLAVAEKGLGELQKKSLREYSEQKKKVNDLENIQRQKEASLSKKQLSEAEKLLSITDAKNDAQRLLNSLIDSGIEKTTEAYKEAEKNLSILDAREKAGMDLLNQAQQEFIENEKSLLVDREKLITARDNLDPAQQQVLLLQEALEASKKQNEFLKDQKKRLENINKAQRFYNNTLGISGKLLKTLGFESSKIQDAIGAGSEAAEELAKELTNGGQKSIGFIGKFRVFSKGLISFVKTLGKEIALVFVGISFKKLIFDPIKNAFNALVSPAKKVFDEITGFASSFVDYITNSFLSIQGFVNTFKEGEGLIKQLSQATEDLATGLGVSTSEAKQLTSQVSKFSSELGAVPEKLAQNMVELNQAFGTTQKFSDETARSFNRMVERLGFSTEEAAEFVKIAKITGETENDILGGIEDQTMALKNQYGVAVSTKSIYQEISKASDATRLTLGNNAKELTNAAFQAKRLGLEMDKVSSMGSSLLDFESSIAKEMEAELLIGRDLNLERARQAALQGDIATVAEEIAGQIGSAAEFGEMNVLQQQALADSVGVSRDELAKMLTTQEMLANTGFDDMNQAQQEFNELVESGMSIEKAQAKFRQKYGDEALAAQVAQVSYAKQKELQERRVLDAQAAMADAMMPVAEAMKRFNENLQAVRKVLFDQMRPFFKEFGVLIDNGGISFQKILKEYVTPLGKRLNDIGLTLVRFARENGPAIKKTFMSILDVFGSIYGLVGDIIKELFNIKGTSSVADPLKNALQLVQDIAKDITSYVKSIDAGGIAEKIKSVITGIGNFYQGLYNFVKGTITTIRDAINYVKENPIKTLLGVGAATGLAALLKRGSSRLFPMFTKNVDGPGGGGMFDKLLKGLKGKEYKGGQFMPGGGRAPAGGAVAGRNIMGLQLGSALGGSAGQTATSLGGTALGTVGVVAGAGMALGAIGKGAYDVAQLNNRSTAGEEATAKGGLGGALGGAAAGAAIGSVIPVVGTVLGAGIGAIIGYTGGRIIGGLDKFEDKLDKSRKKLIKAEEFRTAASNLRKANQDLILEKSISSLKTQFNTLAGQGEGSLELTGSQLKQFADNLLNTGQITTKQYEDALSGVISSSDLLEQAIDNQKAKFAELEASTQAVIDKQIKQAQQEADNLYGDKKVLESQLNLVNNYINESGELNLSAIPENTQQAIEEYGKFIQNDLTAISAYSGDVASKIQQESQQLGKDATAEQKQAAARSALIETGTYSPESTRMMGKDVLERLYDESLVLFEKTANIIDETTLGALTPEQTEIATRAAIEQQTNIGAEWWDSYLGESAEMLGAGFSAVANDIESNLNLNKAHTLAVEANSQQMASTTDKINESLNSLYASFNAQTGEGEAANFINNILGFGVGEDKTLENLFTPEQIENIRSFTTEGIDRDELIAFQKIITQLPINSDFQQLSTLLKSFKDQQIQEAEDGITLIPKIQSVQDGTALSSKGPFTITDKFGATAVTAVNDGVVVSPNITHVNDAITNPVTGEIRSIIIPELQSLELDLDTLNAAIGLLQELLLKGGIPSYEGTQAQALLVDYKDGARDLVYDMERESINIARSVVNTIERMGAAEYLVEIGKQAGDVTETILQGSSPSGSYQNIQYQISKAQTVQDAASISNNGPFTIQDSRGNLAITHPNDKLVVSPNVSYVSDGVSGKGGPVFPVSEKFGALDVKVGKSGVAIQKIKDGVTGGGIQRIQDGGWWDILSSGTDWVFSGLSEATKGTLEAAGWVAEQTRLIKEFGLETAQKVIDTIMDPESELKIFFHQLGSKFESWTVKLLEEKLISNALRPLLKKSPYVGPLIDLAFEGYDLSQIADKQQISLDDLYDKVGINMYGFIGSILGGIAGDVLGIITSAGLSATGVGAILAPAMPWLFNFLGAVAGQYLGEIIAENTNPSWMGKTTADMFFPKTVDSVQQQDRLLAQSSLTPTQNVLDAASISNNGPFKIEDSKGNLAITHPQDKLVVSPNVSYVADGTTGKGGPVFPVSEKFGVLDVKVGKEGVLVQKVKDGVMASNNISETAINHINSTQYIQDGITGITELKEAEKAGMPIEYQPGANLVGVRGPFTKISEVPEQEIGNRTYKGSGLFNKIYKLSSEEKTLRKELQHEYDEEFRKAYSLSKRGIHSTFAVEGIAPYTRTVDKFERIVSGLVKIENEAKSKGLPLLLHDVEAGYNDYGTTVQLGLTEGAGKVGYNESTRKNYVSMLLNTYVEPSKLFKNYTQPTPEPEITESIIPERVVGQGGERITIRGTEGDTFVTYENGKVVNSSTLKEQRQPDISVAFDGIGGIIQKIKDGATASRPTIFKSVTGTTSDTRIGSSEVISQLGVPGVTNENFRNLFVANPTDGYFAGTLYTMGKENKLSLFHPQGPSPALDYFAVNYTDGKTDQILNEGQLSFPSTSYKANDISSIKASGNGLLALARAMNEVQGVANKYTIGFQQDRESSAISFNSNEINNLTPTFNGIKEALLYKTVKPEQDNLVTGIPIIKPQIKGRGGVEEYITNALDNTSTHYIPLSMGQGNKAYDSLGIPHYDYSNIIRIINQIPQLDRTTDPTSPEVRNVETLYKEVANFFIPQYIERVGEFFKQYVDSEKFTTLKESIKPYIGGGFKWDGLFEKREIREGSMRGASLARTQGEYAEGSIQRVSDAMLNSELSKSFGININEKTSTNLFTSTPQQIQDGSALSSRGPFTITDKFGATAVTAKGDGVVVSPNISYVNDGMIDVEPMNPVATSSVQQSTTVIEQDNSELKKELEGMKQLMSELIKELPTIANRPIRVELDGNKVGESLGRITYRG